MIGGGRRLEPHLLQVGYPSPPVSQPRPWSVTGPSSPLASNRRVDTPTWLIGMTTMTRHALSTALGVEIGSGRRRAGKGGRGPVGEA